MASVASVASAASVDRVLADLLVEVAAGRPPSPDGTVRVLGTLGPGVDDVVLALDGHLVITADVPADEVRRRVPDGALTLWGHPAVTLWLAERTGRDLGTTDVLLVARTREGEAPIGLVAADDPPATRLRRRDERTWTTEDGTGRLAIARGLAGRWELSYAVAREAQGLGLGRRLAGAARHLLPQGELLWAQTPAGNVRSLRALLAAGFVPVGGETLLLADRPPPAIPVAGGLELRPTRHADVEAHRAMDDEATRLGFGFPRAATAAEVHVDVARWRLPSDDRVELGVWQGPDLVGHVSIQHLSDGDVELSYVVVPAHRGRGIAVAASRAALAHAVERWGVRRAVIEILAQNAASLAVARRLGAVEVDRRDGHIVHHLVLEGRTGVR